jgi:hypothetical protein
MPRISPFPTLMKLFGRRTLESLRRSIYSGSLSVRIVSLTDRWCGKGGFADRKCTLDDTLDRWFDNRFPPLSIYHGGRDYLVLAEPLIERMKTKEKDVNVIKVTKLDLSEVCPFFYFYLSSLPLAMPFSSKPSFTFQP